MKGLPLFTFTLIEMIFGNLCSMCTFNGSTSCPKKCLAASWATLSHFLLAIYGAQLSQQERVVFTITNVDFLFRLDVVSSIRYLSAVQNIKLKWTPFATVDEWSNCWTLKTR